MNKRIAILFGSMISAGAMAQEMFPAGARSKSYGMDGAQSASELSAPLYNPAAIRSDDAFRTDVEVGYAMAKLSYEHPDFDPVIVEVNSPIVSAGLTGKISSKWSYGLTVFPAKRGELAVIGMPRRVGSDTMPLAVQSKETALKGALGLSWQALQNVSVGAGVVSSMEEKFTSASLIGSAAPLVSQQMKNIFYRPNFGMKAAAFRTDLNVSWMPAITKKYEGKQRKAGEEADSTPNTVAYDAALISAGIGHDIAGVLRLEAYANHREWSRGRDVAKEGLGSLTDEADLKDVIEYGARVSSKILPKHDVSYAVCVLPSPWGEGTGAVGPNGESQMGTGFGAANGIDRQSMAIADRIAMARDANIDVTWMRSTGNREVSESGASPGFYQSQIDVFSVTGSYAF